MSVPTILIVDDEESTRVLLDAVLRKDKYNILTAKNGRDALALFHAHHPNVVILDLYMPVMDGFEFLWEIQPKDEDPFEIIAVTVHASDEEIIRCYDMGVNRVLRKPFVFPEIRKIIQQSIEHKKIALAHRDSEERLKRNESFYKKILSSLADLVLCFKKDPGEIYFNDFCSDLLPPETCEALNGVKFIDLVYSGDRDYVIEKLEELNSRNSHIHFEARSGTDEDHIWYFWTCSGSFDSDGNLLEITALGKDISSDKNVAAELQMFKDAYGKLQGQKAAHLKTEKDKLQRTNETLCGSETRYRNLFDNIDEGIVITELETGTVIDCNQALLDFLGYERTELLAKPLTMLFPEKIPSGNLYESLFGNAPSDEIVSSERIIIDRDGSQKSVRLKTSLIEIKNKKFIQQLVGTGGYSTARYYLKKHIEYISAIIELFPYAIYLKDKNGKFIALNSACERIFSAEKKNLLGSEGNAYIPQKEYNFFLGDDMDILHSMKSSETEEEFMLSSAISEKTVYCKRKIVLSGLEKGLTVLIGVIEDLSWKKKNETALQKAKDVIVEIDTLKAQFIANVSHELRTPLNSILGAADLLSDIGLNEKQKKFADIIKSSGSILLNVMSNILDFSFLVHGKPALSKARFALNDCIDDIMKSMALEINRKALFSEIIISPEIPPFLYGDSQKLKQVLFHLLCNAVKFTEKGEIKLKISRIHDDEDSSDDKKIKLLFVVKDTGIGIPSDKKEEIFKPFNQVYSSTNRKYDGNGLGLAICAMLVQLSNGQIWAESEEGIGSSFYFTMEVENC